MRALSLNCSVARGNQCSGGEGLTSSPICSITETLVMGLHWFSAEDEQIVDDKQKIHQIQLITMNNTPGRSEFTKAGHHQRWLQLVNINDIPLDTFNQ